MLALSLVSAACSAFNGMLRLLELQQVFCCESWAIILAVFKNWIVFNLNQKSKCGSLSNKLSNIPVSQ